MCGLTSSRGQVLFGFLFRSFLLLFLLTFFLDFLSTLFDNLFEREKHIKFRWVRAYDTS